MDDKIKNKNESDLNYENNKEEKRENERNTNKDKRKVENNEYIIMDNTFNEVEKYNAKNILKGDLAEIYEDLIKENLDFKDDIFFVNLNQFEKKIGDCDDKLISHSYQNFKKNELFKQYKSSRELLQKYTDRAERIKNENQY